jgi:hypothetical protein
MKQLVNIFAIDHCSHTVLQNHYHVIRPVDPQIAAEWIDQEAIEHCKRLFG